MTATAPRITTRINEDTQLILSKAAALSGISSINSFVLSAAIEKAKKIIDEENSINLSREDALMLVAALDQPAKENQALQKASQAYKQQNQDNL
jgi:uncharacterized protein (DUF1778 family)